MDCIHVALLLWQDNLTLLLLDPNLVLERPVLHIQWSVLIRALVVNERTVYVIKIKNDSVASLARVSEPEEALAAEEGAEASEETDER